MDLKSIKKLTFTINTLILFLVFCLAGFFYLCKATFLIWFSLPTALVYVLGFLLIANDRLDYYVRIVYSWLTLYMSITTVCLGYKLGFHLYCLSMIPIIFYTEYMAEKLGKKKINAFIVSGLIVICYLLSTGYAAYAGPIYEVNNNIAGLFWIINSAIVLFFLIAYSRIMLGMVNNYEKKITEIAHKDRLTGLYNRHYMMQQLEEAATSSEKSYVAMIDIDNFKQINDQYGHNAGDYVLTNLSRIMQEICTGCEISRWGGEEFLLLGQGETASTGQELVEKLRKRVESESFLFEKENIRVTITVGLSQKVKDQMVDLWVKDADDKLYFGKKNGKNRVII
ncbi:MAG: GGDEF domain-containing protein [Clostridiales bacterium]|nr:GGDEF domain-containing protein [Clostridiales bacterium]MBR4010677.1 GGDEF domain-containing protein [Clostridiales bacterium]